MPAYTVFLKLVGLSGFLEALRRDSADLYEENRRFSRGLFCISPRYLSFPETEEIQTPVGPVAVCATTSKGIY